MDDSRPHLIYDGECAFCRECVEYARAVTGSRVAYEPYQTAAERYPDLTETDFARSIWLIYPNGQRYTGAHATFATLAHNRRYRLPLWLYRHIPGAAGIAEWAYRFVSRRRAAAARVTRTLFGSLRPARTHHVRELFLRGLGIVFLIAFASWGSQMSGLIGTDGILPADEQFTGTLQQLGVSAYWQLPSLLWIHAGALAQQLVLALGILASILLTLGRLPRLALIGAYTAYLSFVSAGGVFMSYQWDALLLEAGFVALLWTCIEAGVWVVRFLVFKFEFLSGIGKLLSGDPTWMNMTALTYHFQTQPLPTPVAWYAHHVPPWVHEWATAFVLFSQTLVPLLLFAPRRVRFVAAGILTLVQVGILLTGNYNFFNLLTLLLIFALLDDRALHALAPQRVLRGMRHSVHSCRWTFARYAAGAAVFMYVFVGVFQIISYPLGYLPEPARTVHTATRPLHLSNTYGLFTNMTTWRPEIVIQGSRDGETWETYEFAYKPDSLSAPLPLVAPHQPRLDWQMWFAALRQRYDNTVWFEQFAQRLLENEPSVTRLLGRNPFPDAPPRFVRARLYAYRYTDPAERAATGDRWERTLLGTYLPTASLQR